MSHILEKLEASLKNYTERNKMSLVTGLFVGSLDPIHNGHLALIKVAKEECDKLVIVVSNSSEKRHLFPLKVRIAQVEAAIKRAGITDVVVSTSNAHISDILLRWRPQIIFRGIRSEKDRAAEEEYYKLATVGLDSKPDLFLIEAEEGLKSLSSSSLKSLLSYGHGILSHLPHPNIVNDMYSKMFGLKVMSIKSDVSDATIDADKDQTVYIIDRVLCDRISSSKLPGVVQDREKAIEIFKSVTGDYSSLIEILNYSVDNAEIDKARNLIARHVRAEVHSGIRLAIEMGKPRVVISIKSAEKCGLNNFVPN